MLFFDGTMPISTLVMPDFMSGIHDFEPIIIHKVVDARDKRGHDGVALQCDSIKTKKCSSNVVERQSVSA